MMIWLVAGMPATWPLAVGKPTDLAVLDAETPEQGIAELSLVLFAFERGRRTVIRARAGLHSRNEIPSWLRQPANVLVPGTAAAEYRPLTIWRPP